MEQTAIGKFLEGGEQRDAIHVAIAPVEAATRLWPGREVGFIDPSKPDLVGECSNPVGIVDPFLKGAINPGQRFYLFLFPNTVTGMRHHWSHPAFPETPVSQPEKPTREESEAWLREFCKTHDCPDYDTVMAAIRGEDIRHSDYYSSAYYIDECYFHFNGIDAHSEIPCVFWDHVEIVLGEPVEIRPHGFSCSC